MKLLHNTICALALVSLPICASAIDTDLAVTGVVVPAANCTPDFSDGGVIDFGTISGTDLGSNRYFDLPAQQIDFSISCRAPTKVGFKLLSNRTGSLADSDHENATGFGLIKHSMDTTIPVFMQAYGTGLGLDSEGGKVGGMLVNIQDRASIVDGSTSILFLEGAGGSYALKNPNASLYAADTTSNHYTWGDYDSGGYLPVAFSTLESTLDVYAFINKRDELDLTQPIDLDGSVTFEIIYL